MGELLRFGFLAIYVGSLAVLLVRVLPAALRAPAAENRARGAERYLPVLLLPTGFLVPPVAMLLRAGEIDAEWTPVRLLGALFGLYALAILPWSAARLGRFLVPQAIVSQDHALVTDGPFRWLRHPAYSGDLALWLGSSLATLNAYLLVLWPLYVLGATAEARVEERLLEEKFGESYRSYARSVGRFVPRLFGQGRPRTSVPRQP